MGTSTQGKDEVATKGSEYRAAARAATAARRDFRARVDLVKVASDYATRLVSQAAEGLEPVFERMCRDAALWRPAVADHVVWSTYDAHNPRRLHVWPRGDRYADIGPTAGV
jgi:hypothetical protein